MKTILITHISIGFYGGGGGGGGGGGVGGGGRLFSAILSFALNLLISFMSFSFLSARKNKKVARFERASPLTRCSVG